MHRLGTFRDRTLAQRTCAPESAPSRADGALESAGEHVPTPIYISHRTRLILLAAVVAAVIWLFALAPSVPRLLVLGSVGALILSFPVRLLDRWMPRGLAILTVMGSTVAAVVVGLILIIPFAINEITDAVAQLPGIADTLETTLRDVLWDLRRRGWIDGDPDRLIEDVRGDLLDRGQAITATFLNNALGALTRSFGIALTGFGAIFIATYLLIDIPRFREKFVHVFSPSYRPDAAQLWSTIGESLSRYLAGLAISIVIQGTMATVGLAVLGVPYAIVLGLWMSVTAILPYVGAFLGGIPAVLVALTISWQMAVTVTVLYVAINLVEGNLITPKVQGSAVRVHPLLIFVVVVGGGQIAGAFGAILAVPTAAVVRVVGEFLWVRLQVPEAQAEDTVLAALGGDDDGDDRVPSEPRAGVDPRNDREADVAPGDRGTIDAPSPR